MFAKGLAHMRSGALRPAGQRAVAPAGGPSAWLLRSRGALVARAGPMRPFQRSQPQHQGPLERNCVVRAGMGYEFDEEEEEDDEGVELLDDDAAGVLKAFARGAGMPDDIDDIAELQEGEAMDEQLAMAELEGDWDAEREGPPADVGEPSTSDPAALGSEYEARPERGVRLPQLFYQAAYDDIASFLSSAGRMDTVVPGVHSNPWAVTPGCVFVLHPWMFSVPDEVLVGVAVENGASCVVVDSGAVLPEGLELPDGVVMVTVEDADEAGQRLAMNFYDDPSSDMVVVGVTGSYGKTTVAWLVRGILEEVGLLTGMLDTIEYAVGEDRLDPDGDIWVPDEPDPTAERECSAPFKIAPYAGKYATLRERLPGLNVQKVLAGMAERGAKCAVMECQPVALDQGFFDYSDVNVAVFTGLGPTDAAYFAQSGSQDPEVMAVEACMRLFTKLEDSNAQAAVVNRDDPLADVFLTAGEVVPVVTYSTRPDAGADVVAESVTYGLWDTEIIVKTPQGRLQVITNLLGQHNVANVLAAVATGVALKAPLRAIGAGIEAVEAVPGRSEVIDEGQPFTVVVDAARTPEQVRALITAVQRGGAKQIFTVLGAAGDESPEQRPALARVAHEGSTYVVLTNENPRTEDPGKIVQDMVAGFPDDMVNKYSNYVYFPFQDQGRVPLWFEPYLQKTQRDTKRYVMEDRFSAIRCVIGTAVEGDAVLLLGKGAEDFIEYGDGQGGTVKGWFDDRVEARNALSKLRYLDAIDLDRSTLPWGPRIEEMMETVIHIPPDTDYVESGRGAGAGGGGGGR